LKGKRALKKDLFVSKGGEAAGVLDLSKGKIIAQYWNLGGKEAHSFERRKETHRDINIWSRTRK